jgi:hypothetical protein
MDINMATVTVFFVGIAAFVNTPPQNNVSKSVIFPAAQAGTLLTTAGETLNLMPHRAYLYVRERDMAPPDTANTPQRVCDRANGEWLGTYPYAFCRIKLDGAKVWTINPATDTVTEDPSFRKMPSFGQYCPYAKDLPTVYLGDPDRNYVAARFDIKGGTMYGCNRNKAAFVSKLVTNSVDSVLYVQQNERTSRIFLNDRGSSFTIENSADRDKMTMDMSTDPTMQYTTDYRGHFGWYYRMNGRSTQTCDVVQPSPVAGIADCPTIPGADDQMGATAAASADCSNSNFP